MFSDKIKFNTPLPGDEFKSRVLTIPAEAAKVLFEIDEQYGEDRELCLSILTKVFRGVDSVTGILRGSGKVFRKGEEGGGALWRQEALIERTLRVSILEMDQVKASKRIKTLTQTLMTLRAMERGMRGAAQQGISSSQGSQGPLGHQ